MAKAATGVVDTVEDKLLADIHVTETQEPNSKVSYLVSFFVILWMCTR